MGADEYVPRQITFDDLGDQSLDDAYAASWSPSRTASSSPAPW
jgi:hypothetical protein